MTTYENKDYEENKYEVLDAVIDEPAMDLLPVPVEPDDENEGMSTGAVIAITAVATAGGIWLGSKLVKGAKKLLGKFIKASGDDKAAEANEEPNEEPAPDTDPEPDSNEA